MVTYRPEGYTGQVTIGYVISDGHTPVRGTIRLSVPVTPPTNQGPTADDDEGGEQATTNGSVRVDVLDNDHDPDGPHAALEITAVSDVDGWTTTIDGGVIEFTYPASFAGAQDFAYTVADGTRPPRRHGERHRDQRRPALRDAVDHVEVRPTRPS